MTTHYGDGYIDSLPRTREVILRGLDRHDHPGTQLYVSLNGEPVADWAVGESRVGLPGGGVDMRRDTLTLWMSSTKPLAAIAIAQQYDRGQLQLDDPVARFIPEFGAHGKDAITIRHVLTHTGGFRSPALNWMEAPWDTQIARICTMRLEPGWTPGNKAGYHTSTGAFILGEIVRRIDGRPFDQYLRDQILLPLQMTDSWVGMPPEVYEAYGERISITHHTDKSPPDPPRPHDYVDTPEACAICRPASGGRGPIRQLARLYEAILNNGALDGARILQPDTVTLLTRPARVGMYDHTFRHTMDCTLAFMLNSWHYGPTTCWYQFGPHASPAAIGHSGHQSSCAFADPPHHLAVAWTCNGLPGEARHRHRWVAINAAIYEDLKLAKTPNVSLPPYTSL